MPRLIATLEALDSRDVPAITPLLTLAAPTPLMSVGADTGGGPHVQTYTPTGQLVFNFLAFEPTFTGGTRVATADFTGDGFDDLAVGAGIGGGPRVQLYDGRTGELLRDEFTFEEGQRGGVFLGAGDVTGDGVFDLVVGAGPGGGPRVKVYEGGTGAVVRDFFAADPNLRGGVYVAAGDLSGDGTADIVAGTGRFNPAYINTFDGRTLERIGSFEGFDTVETDELDPAGRAAAVMFNGGDEVVQGIYFGTVVDHDGDGDGDLLAGRVIGDPEVKEFDDENGDEDDSFYPFGDDGRTQGVRPVGKDLNGDGVAEKILGAGPGRGTDQVIVLDGASDDELLRMTPFPGFLGGVAVG